MEIECIPLVDWVAVRFYCVLVVDFVNPDKCEAICTAFTFEDLGESKRLSDILCLPVSMAVFTGEEMRLDLQSSEYIILL